MSMKIDKFITVAGSPTTLCISLVYIYMYIDSAAVEATRRGSLRLAPITMELLQGMFHACTQPMFAYILYVDGSK